MRFFGASTTLWTFLKTRNSANDKKPMQIMLWKHVAMLELFPMEKNIISDICVYLIIMLPIDLSPMVHRHHQLFDEHCLFCIESFRFEIWSSVVWKQSTVVEKIFFLASTLPHSIIGCPNEDLKKKKKQKQRS